MQEKEQKLKEIVERLSELQTNPTQNEQTHRFWDTQPVTKTTDAIESDGIIEAAVPIESLRKEPYPLGKDFEWVILDVMNETDISSIYKLLFDNYVEDDSAIFRFAYSKEFLQWAMTPPGYSQQFHIGVRVVSNKKLVGFISGVPISLKIRGKVIKMVEINFLCIHKKLRSKRLAPVLIKEVTRRVNLTGVFQALYTAGISLPTPFSRCQYFHRNLNPKKLIDIGFSHLPSKMTLARMIKQLRVPEPALHGFRKMEPKDVGPVSKLLKKYMAKFDVACLFNQEEVKHWFLTRQDVVYSFVVEENGAITDFCSFYNIPSSVIGNPRYNELKAAYLYYYAPKDLGQDPARTQILIKDCLSVAHNLGFDVFNCLDIMDNKQFISDLRFGPGDGFLHYYFYNYKCQSVDPSKLGVVML